MIVCDYVDESVKRFLHGKSGNVVLTFFKEPFNNYKKNNVVFIDDVLDEDDYNKIDIFVNKVMKDTDEIFSKYLGVDRYKLFDYLKLQAKLNLGKIYKFKYCIDKIITKKDNTILYFSSELGLLILLEQDYSVKNLCSGIPGLKIKFRKWKKN